MQYSNLPKIGSSLKILPPPFLNDVVAIGAFLSKVCPPIYAVVRAVMQEAPNAVLCKGRD